MKLKEECLNKGLSTRSKSDLIRRLNVYHTIFHDEQIMLTLSVVRNNNQHLFMLFYVFVPFSNLTIIDSTLQSTLHLINPDTKLQILLQFYS